MSLCEALRDTHKTSMLFFFFSRKKAAPVYQPRGEKKKKENIGALPTASKSATIKLQNMFHPITSGSPSIKYRFALTGTKVEEKSPGLTCYGTSQVPSPPFCVCVSTRLQGSDAVRGGVHLAREDCVTRQSDR